MRPVATAPWLGALPAAPGAAIRPEPVAAPVAAPPSPAPATLLPTSGTRLAAPTENLAQHRAVFGPRPARGIDLLADITAADLAGRGGALVPVAAKWQRALAGHGPLTVVANGAESEPLSAKDAALVRRRPHLVLDGLVATAEALGAEQAVIWLHGSDERTRAAVVVAIAERHDPVAPRLVVGPEHYLAGESSAIAHALDGGPPLPRARRAAVPGGPRTLVHNVETLARVALVARGLASPATTLLTLATPAGREVHEVPTTTPLLTLAARAGWGEPMGALLGGFGGTWTSDLALPADPVVVRAAGLDLGAGVVAPLPADACPVAETAAVLAYLAAMSARQCGPCLFGLPAIADAVRRLADGAAGSGVQRRLAGDLVAVEGRGACHHPDGAVRLVRSLHRAFPAHVAEHARGRRCADATPVLPVPGVPR